MPRSPEYEALRNKWATVNLAIESQINITTFGNFLSQRGFLSPQSVRNFLSVGDISSQVAKLMGAVQTKIEYTPAKYYPEFVLLLHDDLKLTDLAEDMVATCKACYDKEGKIYKSPLEREPSLPAPSNSLSESTSINTGIPSSDKLIKRPTKDRKTEELDPQITHTTTSSDTTSTKGTYCRCSKSMFVVVISLAAFIVLYCFWNTSSHSQDDLPLNFTSLSTELQEINDWSEICKYFNVKTYLINRIEDEYPKAKDRKNQCLSAYLDNGKASWKHVVQVICSYPFDKDALGLKIAKKYHIQPPPECDGGMG